MSDNDLIAAPAPATTPKRPGLRQSMTWAHTWGTLWIGWMLYVVFVSGSLSVFADPITHWLADAPPPHAPLTAEDRLRLVRLGQARLAAETAQAGPSAFWSIVLPDPGEHHLRLLWPARAGLPGEALLDVDSGAPLDRAPGRETVGGDHFIDMHYQFRLGKTGEWLVGLCALAMLAALVSGVIVHKRLFQDFFTFRPGKRQRSWLDAHNVLGVATLPFQLMIAYTGLVVFYWIYLPAGIAAHFPRQDDFFAQLLDRPPSRALAHEAAPIPSLEALARRGEALLQRPVKAVVMERVGDRSAVVRVFSPFHESEIDDPPPRVDQLRPDISGMVLFDAASGEVLQVRAPRSTPRSPSYTVQQAMVGLHEAEFGGPVVRWLYLAGGAAGAALIGTGLVLFTVKRRQKSLNEFGALTPGVYRAIEVLNIGVIAGSCLAAIGLFWANRLLPLDLPQRAQAELGAYLLVWGISLLHAAVRSPARAWREQWWTVAALCALLPALNGATTGQWALTYARTGDLRALAVELVAVAVGALAAFAGWRCAPSHPKEVRAWAA